MDDFAQLNFDLDPAVVVQLLQEPRPPRRWHKSLGGAIISENLERLLNGLLCWKPVDRLSAQCALQEPYYAGIHNLTAEQQAMLGFPLVESTVSEPELNGPQAYWGQTFAS